MSRLLDPQNFVAEKLAWQLQVLTDTSLTPLAKTLAALLMHVLNSKTGDGYRSQAWLAETLGVTGRSIRRACDDLKKAGRLRATAYGVRGKANSYRALLKSEPVAPMVEASTRVVEDPHPGHDRCADDVNSRTGKPDSWATFGKSVFGRAGRRRRRRRVRDPNRYRR